MVNWGDFNKGVWDSQKLRIQGSQHDILGFPGTGEIISASSADLVKRKGGIRNQKKEKAVG